MTPKGLSAWSKIGVIEPSHFDDNTAYIAVDRHRLDDFAPYIFRNRDGGQTWAPIVNGIATGGVLNAVNVVREDTQQKQLLFAGSKCCFLFPSMTVNLAGAAERSAANIGSRHSDLRRRSGDRHARTRLLRHGRHRTVAGFGDACVIGRAPAADAAAYRFRPIGFNGTPMPKDEPLAPNPPDGAFIDYVLPAHVNGPVGLQILEGQGRRYADFPVTGTRPRPISQRSRVRRIGSRSPFPCARRPASTGLSGTSATKRRPVSTWVGAKVKAKRRACGRRRAATRSSSA